MVPDFGKLAEGLIVMAIIGCVFFGIVGLVVGYLIGG